MADQEYSPVYLDDDKRTLRIKGQGYGDLSQAGSGEQHLRSLFGLFGPGGQEILDEMIPRDKEE